MGWHNIYVSVKMLANNKLFQSILRKKEIRMYHIDIIFIYRVFLDLW